MDIQILLDRIDDLRRELGQLVDFEKITKSVSGIGKIRLPTRLISAISVLSHMLPCSSPCEVLRY